MKITEPGIYRDIAEAEYHQDPCPEPSLSQSICKIILDRSPLHAMYEHPRLRNAFEPADEDAEKYNKVQAIGSAAHKIMLGRGKQIIVIMADDFRTKEARAKRDEASAAGHVPILEKHFVVATEVVHAARAQLDHHQDHTAFTKGAGEVALIWNDDGIWCRALVDWLHDDLRTVDDFKTSGMSMAPHVIGIRAETAGWHVQAAFIERGLDILDPANAGRRRFRFIGQEQDARPYALVSVHMDEHWLTLGRKKVFAAMQLWRLSLSSGKWPGYGSRPIVPEYPAFREAQWLDREMSGEFDPDPANLMAG